ncbi:CBM_collapsed_G0012470.mRNA.1.CDS.1 [Saccharomyces cerevisiae]|nr:CBM_collapsed_G0012470.mRNA.1.CDS.1 [Saccharomyces cerevisiae]
MDQARNFYNTILKSSHPLLLSFHLAGKAVPIQYAPGPPINAIDSKLFWWSMYVTPVIWGVFAVLCLLRLKIFYLILVIVAMCLTAWNTYGFRCCDRWEPNSGQSDGQDTNNWFALPSVPGFENLSRLANIQSFFQRQ